MNAKRETLAVPSGESVCLGHTSQWALEEDRSKVIVGVRYLHYTTGNISDVDHNVNNEADGPFECIYVIIGTDFCCIRVFIIIGLSIFNTSTNKPD